MGRASIVGRPFESLHRRGDLKCGFVEAPHLFLMGVVLACVQLCMRMGVALFFYRCVMLARVELLHVSVRMALFF